MATFNDFKRKGTNMSDLARLFQEGRNKKRLKKEQELKAEQDRQAAQQAQTQQPSQVDVEIGEPTIQKQPQVDVEIGKPTIRSPGPSNQPSSAGAPSVADIVMELETEQAPQQAMPQRRGGQAGEMAPGPMDNLSSRTWPPSGAQPPDPAANVSGRTWPASGPPQQQQAPDRLGQAGMEMLNRPGPGGRVKNRLQELRDSGMSQEEALKTLSDEGLVHPRLLRSMMRSSGSPF